MRYPTLNDQTPSKPMTTPFLGYNHNDVIKEGEMYDMHNLSSRDYPVLSPRPKRGVYNVSISNWLSGVSGLVSKDALYVVCGNKLYSNGVEIMSGLSTLPENNPKQLISMGAYLIILPDKKYVNTADTSDKGNIENAFSTATGYGVSISLCDIDGVTYSYTASDTPPTNPQNEQKWLDTSSDPLVFKEYSSYNEDWVVIPKTYIKFQYFNTSIYAGFSIGDGIRIEGLTGYAKDLNGSYVVSAMGSDSPNYFIAVEGILPNGYATGYTYSCTITRPMPDMDFVIESGNRLWGCKYGIVGGQAVNEIYASALGDFKNWEKYQGLSTDSYRASIGTDGQFTGAINYLGYPLFFKEEHLHKVYGNFPSNFQIQHTALNGVEKGSARSLTIVNNVLYYKGKDGVYAYDGSLPHKISYAFGDEEYHAYKLMDGDADYNDYHGKYLDDWIGSVGGTINNKYYISLPISSTRTCVLMVYDTEKRLWHKEDALRVFGFCTNKGDLWYYNSDLGGYEQGNRKGGIFSVLGSGNTISDNVEWYAVSGIFGLDTADKKYITKLNIKMSVLNTVDGYVTAYIQYDSDGTWSEVGKYYPTTLNTFNVIIRPKRCDHFRIRLAGVGDARIYSITKTITKGSDK